MRGFPVLAAAALAAACGQPHDPAPKGNDPASATSIPANSAEPPAPRARPAATGTAIPAAMHGVYDATLEACGRPSDARLTVASRELRFHESIGTVRKVSFIGADAVRVEADYQGEGELWQSARELKLGDGGNRLTISGDGTRFTRVRCPAEAR